MMEPFNKLSQIESEFGKERMHALYEFRLVGLDEKIYERLGEIIKQDHMETVLHPDTYWGLFYPEPDEMITKLQKLGYIQGQYPLFVPTQKARDLFLSELDLEEKVYRRNVLDKAHEIAIQKGHPDKIDAEDIREAVKGIS